MSSSRLDVATFRPNQYKFLCPPSTPSKPDTQLTNLLVDDSKHRQASARRGYQGGWEHQGPSLNLQALPVPVHYHSYLLPVQKLIHFDLLIELHSWIHFLISWASCPASITFALWWWAADFTWEKKDWNFILSNLEFVEISVDISHFRTIKGLKFQWKKGAQSWRGRRRRRSGKRTQHNKNK